ncbi:MAG: carboxypeptidase-like regulatory domain-containing protein [Ekhidna sp.]
MSLSEQIDYSFSYNSQIIEKTGRFTIAAKELAIDKFLSQLLIGTGIEYSFFKDQIILNYKEVEVVSKKKNLFSISGNVKDQNGETLTKTNVFLDGTTIGVATDIDGNYKLESIPPGSYNLVFSHVGFENLVHSISEYNGSARIYSPNMENNTQELQEIEVNSDRVDSDDIEWLSNFVTFKRELIGSTINAQQCVIENPEVIDFFYDKKDKVLRAYSSEPIHIRNDALGYNITYFLESFEKSKNDLRYRGQIKFRNATPLKKTDAKDWNRNRKKSLHGSFNHFRKSLLDNQLKKEGYKIFRTSQLNQLDEYEDLEKLSGEDVLSFKGDHYELEFDDYLIVEYRKENETLEFLRNIKFSSILYKNLVNSRGLMVKEPGHQISIVNLLKKSVKLDLNGQIDDKFGLTTYGYWSWERLADLVPLNYDPKLDKL